MLVLDARGKLILATGAVGDLPASLEISDAQTNKRLHSTELQTVGHGNLAFRPAGRQVALHVQPWGNDNRIDTGQHWVSVVDAETGRVVRTIEGKGKPINDALTYSPDGSLLVGPMDSKTLGVWDAETGKLVRTIDTKEGAVRDAAFRPDGRAWLWLATAAKRRSGRSPSGSPCSRCGCASSLQCAVDTATMVSPWPPWVRTGSRSGTGEPASTVS